MTEGKMKCEGFVKISNSLLQQVLQMNLQKLMDCVTERNQKTYFMKRTDHKIRGQRFIYLIKGIPWHYCSTMAMILHKSQ